ncbi:MAG TPA: hypothetical protein VMF90_22635 [Rhizobiaceae bacterium]|nr:hypothetical protein [Rhizobiaceae bacterium]
MSIVTLPCHIEGHRAVSFDVIGVYDDRVFLEDKHAEWNKYASVADAAQVVFQHCNTTYGTRRVIFGDEFGSNWREIVPGTDAFEIAPYRDGLPFMVFIRAFGQGG